MKGIKVKKGMIVFIILILIFSVISSFAVSKNVLFTNTKKVDETLIFIEKSTGLNNPEKDTGSYTTEPFL